MFSLFKRKKNEEPVNIGSFNEINYTFLEVWIVEWTTPFPKTLHQKFFYLEDDARDFHKTLKQAIDFCKMEHKIQPIIYKKQENG